MRETRTRSFEQLQIIPSRLTVLPLLCTATHLPALVVVVVAIGLLERREPQVVLQLGAYATVLTSEGKANLNESSTLSGEAAYSIEHGT